MWRPPSDQPDEEPNVLLRLRGDVAVIAIVIFSLPFVVFFSIDAVTFFTQKCSLKDVLYGLSLLLLLALFPLLFYFWVKRMELILTKEAIRSIDLSGERSIRYSELGRIEFHDGEFVFRPKRSAGKPPIKFHGKCFKREEVAKLLQVLIDLEDRKIWTEESAVERSAGRSKEIYTGWNEPKRLRYRLDAAGQWFGDRIRNLVYPFAWLGGKAADFIGGRAGRVAANIIYRSGAQGLLFALFFGLQTLLYSERSIDYFLHASLTGAKVGVVLGAVVGLLSGWSGD